ncbi:hypothetical protein NM208_g9270 [Fusarium decemcellulare]|uniref:Uncharacterized protein n=1 Tax=Fusarium decemcellulare TaxID=57161 RepID=A0ACC1S279_9HYPO|nr:hypothetical protein NM208_g9270 [Fusarium decemcellulare]
MIVTPTCCLFPATLIRADVKQLASPSKPCHQDICIICKTDLTVHAERARDLTYVGLTEYSALVVMLRRSLVYLCFPMSSSDTMRPSRHVNGSTRSRSHIPATRSRPTGTQAGNSTLGFSLSHSTQEPASIHSGCVRIGMMASA